MISLLLYGMFNATGVDPTHQLVAGYTDYSISTETLVVVEGVKFAQGFSVSLCGGIDTGCEIEEGRGGRRVSTGDSDLAGIVGVEIKE